MKKGVLEVTTVNSPQVAVRSEGQREIDHPELQGASRAGVRLLDQARAVRALVRAAGLDGARPRDGRAAGRHYATSCARRTAASSRCRASTARCCDRTPREHDRVRGLRGGGVAARGRDGLGDRARRRGRGHADDDDADVPLAGGARPDAQLHGDAAWRERRGRVRPARGDGRGAGVGARMWRSVCSQRSP